MIQDILTKPPFVRITPKVVVNPKMTNDPTTAKYPTEKATWEVVSQSDFLREYYPTGHKINSPEYYPNKIKYDEKTERFFEEKVFRASFPFQMIITVQQLVHLCGNDIHFELTDSKVNSETESQFLDFQRGWLEKKMEIAWYDLAKSVKIIGDGAIVFYLKDKKLHTRNLSFLNGDSIYPHYDSITGKIDSFARKFVDYDDDGRERVVWVEAWDDAYMYRYRQDKGGFSNVKNAVLDVFGLDSFRLVEKTRHGFDRCPVVYHRNADGPCWSFSQDNIDKYEMAVSHMCQNNMAYAFPIMVLKGEDIEIQGDVYGAVKAITMGPDDDASFLGRPEASKAFELQLNTLLKMIFMGSFVVMPPEVKSGDLPGVAIKLIYSPSLEKAMTDCKEFDYAINEMKELFLFGYGVERGMLTQFQKLSIFSWAVPYIHQNTAELIQNLVSAANSGILSKQSASEITGYDKNNEWDRIIREQKEEQAADLLYQINTRQSQTQSATEQE